MEHHGYGDERNAAILAMLEDVHSFAVPLPPFRAEPGELLLDAHCVAVASTPAFQPCADDAADFLRRMTAGSPAGTTAQQLRFERGGEPGRPVVAVHRGGVTILAADRRDAWQGLVWIERHMAARHAPVLPLGETVLALVYDLRITTSMFARGFDRPTEPEAYTAPYLCSMAHLGYTALFLYINLWDFTHSEILPELDGADPETSLTALRALADRAGAVGLRLVLMVNAPRIQPEHPVFARYPQLKGGIVMRLTGHALCTSEPLTHDYYAEQLARLARGVPDLAALAFLIGGEGFLHCYTRPVPRTERVTNCARCGQKKASEVLIPFLNRLVEAVKEAAPHTRLMFWPYSSYIWQREPRETYEWAEDLAVIRGLDPRATWLLEIDKDAVQEIEGVGAASVWDYSIQYIGPSPKLQLESAALRARGVDLAVKTETNLSVELHALPYLPVMHRWTARHRAVRASGARVAWETWRFSGFWYSPSAEVAYWLSLEPDLSDDEVLGRIARRLYGDAAAPEALRAWRLFSDAWESFYVLYGTYWSGPLILGPAHPLDQGAAFMAPWLWSKAFYQVCPGLRETESPAFLADPRNQAPMFMLFAEGHHAARLRDLRRVASLFREGMTRLDAALTHVPPALHKQAQSDRDLARMVGIYVEADVAFNEFVPWRDRFAYGAANAAERAEAQAALADLRRQTIVRCEEAIAIARRNPFVGWGYTYGVRFNIAMLEENLRHLRAALPTA